MIMLCGKFWKENSLAVTSDPVWMNWSACLVLWGFFNVWLSGCCCCATMSTAAVCWCGSVDRSPVCLSRLLLPLLPWCLSAEHSAHLFSSFCILDASAGRKQVTAQRYHCQTLEQPAVWRQNMGGVTHCHESTGLLQPVPEVTSVHSMLSLWVPSPVQFCIVNLTPSSSLCFCCCQGDSSMGLQGGKESHKRIIH